MWVSEKMGEKAVRDRAATMVKYQLATRLRENQSRQDLSKREGGEGDEGQGWDNGAVPVGHSPVGACAGS